MEEYLWVEKYRPKTLEDCIIPEEKKAIFREFVKSGHVPNILIVSRSPGTGKTTLAKAILNDIGAEYIVMNGSLYGNIDILRNEITDYSSAVSFNGMKKYIIIDEADNMSAKTQLALRNFIEENSKNCGFILTANYEGNIIEPIRSSRNIVHSFEWNKEQKREIVGPILKALCRILDSENVSYDKKIVAAILKRNFPDIRKMIGVLQNSVINGELTTAGVGKDIDSRIDSLIPILKNKDFREMRKWVMVNADIDLSDLVSYFSTMDVDIGFVSERTLPELILILADYQFKHAFAADRQLNITAMLTEILMRVDFE